jgi:putative aminopeptidase FrvX
MHIDCDTYESTNDILNNIPIKHFQKGTIILLDDYISYYGWKDNVFKSFQEWVKKNNIKYTYQVFGKKSAQVILS